MRLDVLADRELDDANSYAPYADNGNGKRHPMLDIDWSISEAAPTDKLIAWTFERFSGQRMVMTTSFGMEGCALIDMYARHDQPLDVIYLDTMFFFPETYKLRDEMAERYPHIRFINRSTKLAPEHQAELYGPELWKRNPDLCCKIRKVDPMFPVMADVDVWIAVAGACTGQAGDGPDGDRHAEDSCVMAVDLVLEAGLADLVEPLEPVQADGEAVGHDHAMKEDGQPLLPEVFGLGDLSKNLRTLRDKEMLAVPGPDRDGYHAISGAREVAREPVCKNRFENGSLIEPVGSQGGRLRIDPGGLALFS